MMVDKTLYVLLQSQKVGLTELLAYSVEQAIALFKRLSIPDYRKMDGEFEGHSPLYIRAEWEAFVENSGMGRWLGKGFSVEPRGGASGQGYNIYRKNKNVVRRLKFAWSIQPSDLDGARLFDALQWLPNAPVMRPIAQCCGKKTGRPVKFELTDQRQAVDDYLKAASKA